MTLKQTVACALVLLLCGAPELLKAQQSQTAPPAGASKPAAQAPAANPGSATQAQPASPSESTTPQNTNGVNVDPSQGPLQPVPSETPVPPDSTQPAGKAQTAPADSSSQALPQSDQAEPQNLPANPEPQKPAEPVGAAAAEKGRTAGGAASKPAGTAIAPAKQGQVRSWLIRIGAIAAAGAAFGTVYALSRKSPSTPPGVQTLGVH